LSFIIWYFSSKQSTNEQSTNEQSTNEQSINEQKSWAEKSWAEMPEFVKFYSNPPKSNDLTRSWENIEKQDATIISEKGNLDIEDITRSFYTTEDKTEFWDWWWYYNRNIKDRLVLMKKMMKTNIRLEYMSVLEATGKASMKQVLSNYIMYRSRNCFRVSYNGNNLNNSESCKLELGSYNQFFDNLIHAAQNIEVGKHYPPREIFLGGFKLLIGDGFRGSILFKGSRKHFTLSNDDYRTEFMPILVAHYENMKKLWNYKEFVMTDLIE
jgi:hypothetical protein